MPLKFEPILTTIPPCLRYIVSYLATFCFMSPLTHFYRFIYYYCFCAFYFSYSYPLFTQRVFFTISYRAVLGVMNSFSFCLSGKLSLLLWMIALLGRVFLAGDFFFLLALWLYPCHSLLPCKVSVEKSADSLMGFPLYVTVFFSLVAFKILYHYFLPFELPRVLVWISLGWFCWGISVPPGFGCLCPSPD